MDAPVVLKSNKGINDKIYYQGYHYIKDGHNVDKTTLYYSCANYKSMHCPSRLLRYLNKADGEQLKTTKSHSHAGDARIVGTAVAIDAVKRKAESTTLSSRSVISKIAENMDAATAAALASNKNLAQTMLRVRNSSNAERMATNLMDLVIPERLTVLKNDEMFLLYDS